MIKIQLNPNHPYLLEKHLKKMEHPDGFICDSTLELQRESTIISIVKTLSTNRYIFSE